MSLRLAIDPKLQRPVVILALAYVAVFVEASFDLPRAILGAQIDLLPSLMVCAALRCGLGTITALAMSGGLWFDSFSANPLGVSVLPLFLIGLGIFQARDLLWRQSRFAQASLGAMAGAAQPLGALFLMMNAGRAPLLGWKTLWQWFVLTAAAGALTPPLMALVRWLENLFGPPLAAAPSFRADREIKRGKA